MFLLVKRPCSGEAACGEGIDSEQLQLGKICSGELACICKRLGFSLDLVSLYIVLWLLKLLHQFGITAVFKKR